jgi:hypothetical protein
METYESLSMKISVITSFDKKYHDSIGQYCVSSWLKYWPEKLNLTCYVEEFSLPTNEKIIQISFTELAEEYFQLQNDSKIKDRVKIFSKKAYSIIHAFENIDADRIIWIDADIITKDFIDIEMLEKLCAQDTLATFMGVWHGKNKQSKGEKDFYSCETGFFVVNKSHKGFHDFSKRYREYYDKRITTNLRRFYDGEVFGAVILELKEKYKFRDLSEELQKQYNSPLRHTDLGKYLDHHKSKQAKKNFITN